VDILNKVIATMQNQPNAWEEAKNYLKDKLGESVFETWIMPLRARIKNEQDIILGAPDNFFRAVKDFSA